MTEVAAPLEHRSRWLRAWAVLRGHEEVTEVGDQTVSFAELVWAHFKRQQLLDQDGEKAADAAYRQRLKRFKADNGEVLEMYWCRYEASGIAVTELQRPRRLLNFLRPDSELRFHTATDWRTHQVDRIESALQRWETMSIQVSEILRDTSEKIALHRVYAASTRLLAFADRKRGSDAAADPDLTTVLVEDREEWEAVRRFYVQAGESSARIVYFRGMILGTFALAALVGAVSLVGWRLGWLDVQARRGPAYALVVTIAMGAAGAVLSVMTRMRRHDGWGLEWEVGRKSVRFLGSIRPWIGATFAFVLYLALKSQLVDAFPEVTKKQLYFYATVAFLAGFSERWAQVLLGGVLREPGQTTGRAGHGSSGSK